MANKHHQQARLLPVVTWVIALLVYHSTLPAGLTWANYGADGGELITAAVTGGIPHPPGYPTYMLFGQLLSWLSCHPLAYCFNLFSAVCIAAAAAVVTTIAQHLQKSAVLALSSGLTLAFMPLVWSQALITEVYGLNLFVLALALWSLYVHKSPYLSGFLCGLSLTTHLTSIFILPLALIKLSPKQWLRFGGTFFLGLTPFLWLLIRAQNTSPVMWGDATTIAGWWWLVSGRIYQSNLFSASNQLIYSRLQTWSAALGWQLGYIGWGLIAYATYKKRPDIAPFLPLGGSAALYAFYALGYDSFDAAVFTLPALLLLSVALIFALQSLPRAALFLPLVLLTLNFQSLSYDDSDQIETISQAVLQQMPEQAIVLAEGGGQTIFTLWYFHHVEGVRSDLVL
ncbi:MAG: DUF2723 domain-containing protein, partial [Anaerolineales bacterium]|nr:DUF2723 domain-containing protein [Anaerolineales bacterium]